MPRDDPKVAHLSDYERIREQERQAEQQKREGIDPLFVPDDHKLEIVRPTLFRAADWANVEPPEMDWIVPGWIPRKQVTGLYGAGGSLKTWLMLQGLMARAVGLPFLGHILTPGPSLGLFCEDTPEEIVRRKAKIARFYERPLSDFADFHWISLVGVEDTELVVFDGQQMTKTELLRWLDYTVQRLRIGFVALDTLGHIFGGDEVKRGHVGRFMRVLDAISITRDCAIMFSAHPSVRGKRDGTMDSGSTGWEGGVRARLGWGDPTAAEDHNDSTTPDPDQIIRVLTLLKANHAAPGRKLELLWRDKLGFVPTAVASELPHPQRGPVRDTACEAKFVELLIKVGAAGDYVHNSRNDPGRYAPMVFAQRPDGKHYSQAEYLRAMGRLFATERLIMEPFGPPSRGKRRLAEAQP